MNDEARFDEGALSELAGTMVLGALLERLRARHGGFELLDHWQQGEFHHDVVLRVGAAVLVVATNCNGGVKEVLAFDEVPERYALWRWRCPQVDEFASDRVLPALRGRAVTDHWFDPCVLLADDARSELRPEHRVRQRGGGFCVKRAR